MEFFFFWLIFSGVVTAIARNRGRSAAGFFLLSLLLSPLIGLIVVLLSKPNRHVMEQRAVALGEMRKCPFCAELVKREALICRYCGRDLPLIPSVVDRATTEAPPVPPVPLSPSVPGVDRTSALAYNVAIVIGVVAIAAVLMWSSAERPAPTARSEPRRGVVVPTEIPTTLAITFDRYGRPDQDYSAEDERPRPPIVTRLLSYQAEHVRLIYMPTDFKLGMPPPYRNGWVLVGALDPVAETKISSQEAARRLAGRAR